VFPAKKKDISVIVSEPEFNTNNLKQGEYAPKWQLTKILTMMKIYDNT
jgi:hypothetical protein